MFRQAAAQAEVAEVFRAVHAATRRPTRQAEVQVQAEAQAAVILRQARHRAQADFQAAAVAIAADVQAVRRQAAEEEDKLQTFRY
jgi:hypothetical protein